MFFCALAHLSCSLFVVTFCCSSLPNPLNCGSQLTAYNVARKESGEPEANENDPSIYAMENKSAWRIDGSKWKDVCSLASCLIVMRDIVCHNLQSYIKHHPESQKIMQPISMFNKWMTEWASNLTLTYKMPQIKKLLEVCLECLESSKARSVEWLKAPEDLQDYMKDHYTPFYRFHFPQSSDSETDSDNEEIVQPSAKKTFAPNSDSDQEFQEGEKSGITGDDGQFTLESPHRQDGDLSLKYCEFAVDEVDECSRFSFGELMAQTSKDASFSNSLFGSPTRQPSSSLSNWPLPSIAEGAEGAESVENEVESWLQAGSVVVHGAGETPENVHAYAVKYRLLKESLEHVQLTLLEFPQFSNWQMRHDPFERPVPLAQHPEQLQFFQTWVDLVESPRPTTAQAAVSIGIFFGELVSPKHLFVTS